MVDSLGYLIDILFSIASDAAHEAEGHAQSHDKNTPTGEEFKLEAVQGFSDDDKPRKPSPYD
jgi:hypothetical protein